MSQHGRSRPREDLRLTLDTAPGDTGPEHPSFWQDLQTYVLGLVLAGGLTALSFWAVTTHVIYGPSVPVALAALAIAQMGVHLVFFLHMTSAPDNTNNALALAFGMLIVGLVFFGSLWIMGHLNDSLMPHDNPMSMTPR
jgi:cytochrome o ubiquinol oxidase subunit IV